MNTRIPGIILQSSPYWGLAAILISGCGLSDAIAEREKKKEAKKAKIEAEKRISEQSTKIWQESAQKKQAMNKKSTGGKLIIGEQILTFTDLELVLGSFKIPGDVNGGQNPSELRSFVTNSPTLRISEIPLEAVINAQKIAGSLFNFSETMNDHAEITSADGAKWKFQHFSINFTRAEGNIVFIEIEGDAVEGGSQNQNKIKVTGEVRARVTAPDEKPAVEGPTKAASE